MDILNLQQGSAEWIAARTQYLCASDAAAMLGYSKRVSRSELLRMKATGDERAFSAWEQENLLDSGHEIERKVRARMERDLGEDLYPTVGVRGKLLASLDGLSEDGTWTLEAKKWNEELVADVNGGDVPDTHWPQLEQQILVADLDHVRFVVSNGKPVDDPDFHEVTLDYRSKPERRDMLIRGWKLFVDDLKAWQHVERVVTPVGTSQTSTLPVLLVSADGKVTASNFPEYKAAALAMIGGIKTDLVTDQDFADAEATEKSLDKAERDLEAMKERVLAGMSDVHAIVTGLEELRVACRNTRLTLNKSTSSRKETRRAEIVGTGVQALQKHIDGLNARLGRKLMPAVPSDFPGAVRGKKSFAKMIEAVDGELTRAKLAANAIADSIQANLQLLDQHDSYRFLFADLATVCLKACDDFAALVKTRIGDHQQAEAKKKADQEAETERRRVAAEAERQRQAEAARPTAPQQAAPATRADSPTPSPTQSAPAPVVRVPDAVAEARRRPADETIICAVADAFHVSGPVAVEWMRTIQWDRIQLEIAA